MIAIWQFIDGGPVEFAGRQIQVVGSGLACAEKCSLVIPVSRCNGEGEVISLLFRLSASLTGSSFRLQEESVRTDTIPPFSSLRVKQG